MYITLPSCTECSEKRQSGTHPWIRSGIASRATGARFLDVGEGPIMVGEKDTGENASLAILNVR
jgi:hypothetical protein